MTGLLSQEVTDYLAVRRSLGYRMARPEKLLPQFTSYLEQAGAATVTTEHALAWAVLPCGSQSWHAYRLAVARGFAAWLRTTARWTSFRLTASARRAAPASRR